MFPSRTSLYLTPTFPGTFLFAIICLPPSKGSDYSTTVFRKLCFTNEQLLSFCSKNSITLFLQLLQFFARAFFYCRVCWLSFFGSHCFSDRKQEEEVIPQSACVKNAHCNFHVSFWIEKMHPFGCYLHSISFPFCSLPPQPSESIGKPLTSFPFLCRNLNGLDCIRAGEIDVLEEISVETK